MMQVFTYQETIIFAQIILVNVFHVYLGFRTSKKLQEWTVKQNDRRSERKVQADR